MLRLDTVSFRRLQREHETSVTSYWEQCYRHFMFKSWYGPVIQVQTRTGSWTQIPLAVNDLTGNTTGGSRAFKAFKSLGLDRTSSNCQVVKEFYSSVFLSEIRDFCHFQDIIHSVGVPVRDPPPKNVHLT